MLLIGCEQGSITLITFDVIEPAKVKAGAVHEKTEHLDKMVCDRDSLFIFPHRTKLTFEDWIQLNTFQIPCEKDQSGTTCDSVIDGLNCTNTLLVFTLKFGIVSHKAPYLLGEFVFQINYLVTH